MSLIRRFISPDHPNLIWIYATGYIFQHICLTAIYVINIETHYDVSLRAFYLAFAINILGFIHLGVSAGIAKRSYKATIVETAALVFTYLLLIFGGDMILSFEEGSRHSLQILAMIVIYPVWIDLILAYEFTKFRKNDFSNEK